MSQRPITELEIREHLRTQLAQMAASSGQRLFEEMSLENGASRVDLALVGETWHAYEIKSDLDNFSRLHNQIHAYNRVFDCITMVTTNTHAPAALQILPSWWGVDEVQRDATGAIRLTQLRPATPHTRQDPHSLAMFLWKEEAMGVLSQANAAAPKRANRWELCERLVAALSMPQLRQAVSQALLSRA